MRFKVDENLHVEVADLLRGQGHDALTVFDQGLRGRDDHDIADICRSEGYILLSLDLDFSNILMFPPKDYPGLIVLRLRNRGRAAVRRVVTRVMEYLGKESIAGHLWIVDEYRIRIHRVSTGHDVDNLP